MTANAPTLSWVLPLYRTAEQLDELLARIHAVSMELVDTYEVVLVDDACPDGCGARAEAAAAADPRVRVLRLPTNGGQDAALRAGLHVARGEWTMILDADLQDPPEALRLLWPLRGDDTRGVVFAQRTGTYTTPGRHLSSRVYRATAAWLGGLPRGACLFALVGREVVVRIEHLVDRRLSLLAVLSAAGGRFASVPVPRERRSIGTSAYSTRARVAKAVRSLWHLLGARRLRTLSPFPSLPPGSP